MGLAGLGDKASRETSWPQQVGADQGRRARRSEESDGNSLYKAINLCVGELSALTEIDGHIFCLRSRGTLNGSMMRKA